jgi:adenine-specific DNA-methyltransferase
VVALSCKLEGHPLGGGMLKLEPREAAQVLLPPSFLTWGPDANLVAEAAATLRS